MASRRAARGAPGIHARHVADGSRRGMAAVPAQGPSRGCARLDARSSSRDPVQARSPGRGAGRDLQGVAERGSTVTIVEDLSSEGATPRIAIPHVDLYAGPGARVRYVAIRRFAPGVVDFGFQRFRSANDSDVAVHNVFAGEGNSKVGIQSDIEGNGATVKLYGLVAAGDRQRIDVNSFQRLDGKSSQSDLLYLSALYDHAKAIFYGKIRVEATSSGTGSYQECRNMLLSKHAGADPIPVLEILTNDVVRCGHGATAGALGDEDLFYAMSRGFDRDQAQQLMVHGFFRRVINQLDDEHVRQRVLNALRPRIGNIAEMGVLA